MNCGLGEVARDVVSCSCCNVIGITAVCLCTHTCCHLAISSMCCTCIRLSALLRGKVVSASHDAASSCMFSTHAQEPRVLTLRAYAAGHHPPVRSRPVLERLNVHGRGLYPPAHRNWIDTSTAVLPKWGSQRQRPAAECYIWKVPMAIGTVENDRGTHAYGGGDTMCGRTSSVCRTEGEIVR